MTSQLNKTGLMWFRHDLRMGDNPALLQLSQSVDHMICVYVIDPRWFKSGHYQSKHMGDHRFTFLLQSLHCLHTCLAEHGQKLFILKGHPIEVITDIINNMDISVIASNAHPGLYERQQWQRVVDQNSEVDFIHGNTHTLFDLDQFPFTLSELPENFTPFKHGVADIQVRLPAAEPKTLPPSTILCSSFHIEPIQDIFTAEGDFLGGHRAGHSQLNEFTFASHNIATYKDTRDELEGWEYSSKFSPWLADGSLSAKYVYQHLSKYEGIYGENESSALLKFELLWREYFQWYQLKHKSKLFRFSGVRDKRPLTSFIPQRFAMWCQGETPYPLVNACMNQLNQTGFMSNRGRQIVASCLVNELGVDWRYGAAYLEQQLIDFDVASNWGNWQFIAGVGADPKGGRKFDLQKQAELYDPIGEFTDKWQGNCHVSMADTVDEVDWPIE